MDPQNLPLILAHIEKLTEAEELSREQHNYVESGFAVYSVYRHVLRNPTTFYQILQLEKDGETRQNLIKHTRDYNSVITEEEIISWGHAPDPSRGERIYELILDMLYLGTQTCERQLGIASQFISSADVPLSVFKQIEYTAEMNSIIARFFIEERRFNLSNLKTTCSEPLSSDLHQIYHIIISLAGHYHTALQNAGRLAAYVPLKEHVESVLATTFGINLLLAAYCDPENEFFEEGGYAKYQERIMKSWEANDLNRTMVRIFGQTI